MAQYQHLPIYKITYDLLVKTTEVTRHFPRDFKTFATRLREEMIDIVLLIYRANSDRTERARLLTAIVVTKAIPTTPTAASTLPHLVTA